MTLIVLNLPAVKYQKSLISQVPRHKTGRRNEMSRNMIRSDIKMSLKMYLNILYFFLCTVIAQ